MKSSPEFPPVRIMVHDEEGKPLEGVQVSMFQAATKEGGKVIEVRETSDARGVAVNRNVPFGHYEVSAKTSDGWYLPGYKSQINVEFEKGLDVTFVAPTPSQFARFVIRDDVGISSSASLSELHFGVLEESSGRTISSWRAPEPDGDRKNYETFPTLSNGIEHIGAEVLFAIEKNIPQPALSLSHINTTWQWLPGDKTNLFHRYLIVDGYARGLANGSKPFNRRPKEESEFFKLPSGNHRAGGTLLTLGKPNALPLELEIPAGDIKVLILRFLGKPNGAVTGSLDWRDQANQPEL